MASLTPTLRPPRRRVETPVSNETRKVVRDSVAVTFGGQIERALGIFTALALRWWLDPTRLGVYTGLRLFLDNTNRTSLGIGVGAAQRIPILRASGREAEARRLADVAHTTNTLTCLAYAAGLVAWACWRSSTLSGDPLAREWTWGLVAVAGLVLIKRYESFLVAILRAHREFALSSEVDVVESLASAAFMGLGLWWFGFWGLLGGIALMLGVKIAYMRVRHPLRFRWCWDVATAWRLMVAGLPILVNSAIYSALLSVDRVIILARLPDGARAAGLYSIALVGTGWALDLAGRIVLVMYTSFQTTLGRCRDPVVVTRQAARATEAQAPLLLAGSAGVYLVGPALLGCLMPRYVEGLPALRPLLPGMVAMSLAWPSRQLLVALDRHVALGLTTLTGLGLTTAAAIAGADSMGLVGLAWGISAGFTSTFLAVSAAAFAPTLGVGGWLRHLSQLLGTGTFAVVAALLATHVPSGLANPRGDLVARVVILTAVLSAWLILWARREGWGGLFRHD